MTNLKRHACQNEELFKWMAQMESSGSQKSQVNPPMRLSYDEID